MDTPPRLLGPYCLLRPLAEGGMGAVHIATALDEPDARLCLIKTLKPGADQGSDEYLRRFLDEARVALRLQGDHLCHVFDAGEADGERFLAMELIEGVTFRRLSDLIAATGRPLPVEHAVTLGLGLLRGLQAAHAATDDSGRSLGIVHRDVSPQNVMVDRFGQVKVIDFGLATSTLKETVTEQAVVMGKMAYMAPEQARGELVTAAADQYAAAVVLYELITGDRFYGDLPSRGIWGIVGAGTHRPRTWDLVPAALQPVLARGLAPHPDERFPDCASFAAALSSASAALGPAVSSSNAGRRLALRDFVAPLLVEDLAPVEEARARLGSLPSSLRQGVAEATQRVRVRLHGAKANLSTLELMRPVTSSSAARDASSSSKSRSSGASRSSSVPLAPHEATEAMSSARAAVLIQPSLPPPPASSSMARQAAVAIAVTLVAVVVLVGAVRLGRRAPVEPVTVVTVPVVAPPPPPVTPPPVTPPVTPPVMAPPVVEAPPPAPAPVVVVNKPRQPKAPTESAEVRAFQKRLAALGSCSHACVASTAGALAKATQAGRRLKAATKVLARCEDTCARR